MNDNITLSLTKEEARIVLHALEAFDADRNKHACDVAGLRQRKTEQITKLLNDPSADDFLDQMELCARFIRVAARLEKEAVATYQKVREMCDTLRDALWGEDQNWF